MIDQYNVIRIDRYLRGQMSGEEMHRLEKEALEDPLLEDALDGYRDAQHISREKLSLLQQRLQARIAEQPHERSKLLFAWQRLGIAGVASLFIILACILLWMRGNLQRRAAHQNQVVVEVDSREGIPNTGGLFTARKLALESADPVGGWAALNTYISQNKSIAEKGRIIVHADVDRSGKPINLRFEQGNKMLEAEVRRLLEEGPKWTGSRAILALEFVF